MLVTINLPINMEIANKNSGFDMLGKEYPISFDGRIIGNGTVVKIDGFKLTYDADKVASEYIKNNIENNEVISFSIES